MSLKRLFRRSAALYWSLPMARIPFYINVERREGGGGGGEDHAIIMRGTLPLSQWLLNPFS